MKSLTFTILILSILLAGCSPTLPSPNLTPDTGTPDTETPAVASPVSDATITVAAPRPNVSPTPDLRLDPETWQEWPVIPQVSARAREIYQKGLALGNDPKRFSKIGDCQSVPASFLGIYETDRYSFAPEYQTLQETVDFYNGSFEREGESVRGGFNTSSVLLPFWANAEVCEPGESPMACENRIHNPSVVFISLEVWFEGRTPDVYEKYLRQIIEFNIEQGALPILATKADNVEGDHSINRAIAKLAHEYDLPLWNYWRAVQPLPNHGLDPTDMTGFHLNVDGWNMRSFSALQVLDAVHRATADLTADGASLATPTPTLPPLASFTPGPLAGLPFSRVIPASADSAPASLLFGFSTRAGETLTSAGIFQSNLNGRDFLAIAASGLTLLDYSDAGILASQGQNLYLITDSARTLLTDQLVSEGIFLADGRVAAILQSENGNQLAIFTEGVSQIIAAESAPQILHPSLDPSHLYWSADNQIFSTALSDLTSTALPYTGHPAFAADGKMAFLNRDAEGKNQLTLVNSAETRTIPMFGNRLVDMQWSPDGSTLAVSVANVSDYSGLTLASKLYFVSWPASLDKVLEMTDEAAIERHVWSPDGKSLLLVTRNAADGRIRFSVLDAAAQIQIPALGFDWTSEEYLLLQPIFWLP
ncbi:MAG: hypothetical protein HY867_03900 [Chloroflexi bacterium]|nr:hypothetical protein [Chloroflexota bacterium]